MQPAPLEARPQEVAAYLRGLQQRIVSAIEAADGSQCVRDEWHKAPDEPLQGSGLTCILEGGGLFERAGCGFSQVRGPKLPPSATQHRPELAGAPFEAMGVSLVKGRFFKDSDGPSSPNVAVIDE